MKIKELNHNKDWVVDVITAVIVVVVTISPISHHTRVCQGSDTNWSHKSLKKAHTILS